MNEYINIPTNSSSSESREKTILTGRTEIKHKVFSYIGRKNSEDQQFPKEMAQFRARANLNKEEYIGVVPPLT
jgi:hypothetical protein